MHDFAQDRNQDYTGIGKGVTRADDHENTTAHIIFFSLVILYFVWHFGRYYEYTQALMIFTH